MLEKKLDFQNDESKKFIVVGELSGDKTAAWFVKKMKQQEKNIFFEGVGGDSLNSCGVKLYERFEKLNVVGIIEILKHLPFILRFMRTLLDYIKFNCFDEVILVDFPGFNLRLAKKLRKYIPGIKVTYLAPPQIWCWGEWRVKKIKKYCDRVVVLYPFEVQWYAERGVTAEWMGNPSFDQLETYFDEETKKEKLIALIPGSRISEIKRFVPLLAKVVKLFLEHYSDVKFVMPVAESISAEFLQLEIINAGLSPEKIQILQSESEKIKFIKKCCLAITKPGTVTLELALLGIPAVVFFRISWLTYILARPLVQVKFMSLPNLLLDGEVYKECIQRDCGSEFIFDYSRKIYQGFIEGSGEYKKNIDKLYIIRRLLGFNRL